MVEYSQMTGHASYEYAYRDPELWSWLLEQRCAACAGPSRHHTLSPSAAERPRLEAPTKLAKRLEAPTKLAKLNAAIGP